MPCRTRLVSGRIFKLSEDTAARTCTHNTFTVVVNFFDVTTKSYQLKALTITPLNPEYKHF